jgi:TatD DNase family protein
MLIDTHCHLDNAVFDEDRLSIIAKAKAVGVSNIVIPAVGRHNFDHVIALNNTHPHIHYALGIHPMFVDQALDADLAILNRYLAHHQPVAVGEIGLDYYVTKQNQARQIAFFVAQLKLAKQYNLPVILHVRGAIDNVLKYLRQYHVVGGIAHAFNGSLQQADQLIALGFKLGFGGAMTYSRALKLRALAKKLPLSAIVLETDAPDMAPRWLPANGRNNPVELFKIAEVLAEIRGVDVQTVTEITTENVHKVLPKIPSLCT